MCVIASTFLLLLERNQAIAIKSQMAANGTVRSLTAPQRASQLERQEVDEDKMQIILLGASLLGAFLDQHIIWPKLLLLIELIAASHLTHIGKALLWTNNNAKAKESFAKVKWMSSPFCYLHQQAPFVLLNGSSLIGRIAFD